MNQVAIQSTTTSSPRPQVPAVAAPRPFEFEGSRFRNVDRDGEPWFVASDLAACLGYRDAGNMLRNLDEDEKGTHCLSSALTELRVGIVSEAGVYHAINARRQVKKLPDVVKARILRFQRWVNHEVLPTIRRTGSYALPAAPAVPAIDVRDPGQLSLIALQLIQVNQELSTRLATTETRAVVAEAAVEAARPALDFIGALVDSEGLYGLQQAGKSLGQRPNGFVNWLLERGDLYRRASGLCARQYLIDRGIMDVRWEEHGGKPRPTTKVTAKGIVHYAKVLGIKAPELPRQGYLPGL
ncbi:phage antirepressor [Methylobacterium iners]|uniref:Bro-N domain-containing protein n=1 Tax=Methylobacterium iners TaxID=418707 RepID=A0ABQ4S332_9HYPH|nr:phage antirepressor KilAC domain-containing protein [Methylobacterium iners]GJD97451.1 hypothetical protein OCOJLMKI_4682 [Methylobacterium iners]